MPGPRVGIKECARIQQAEIWRGGEHDGCRCASKLRLGEGTMTRRQRSQRRLFSAVWIGLALVLLASPALAQRQWTFAADDGSGVSVFYDVEGVDVVLEFRNESRKSARIQYQLSCEGRGRHG